MNSVTCASSMNRKAAGDPAHPLPPASTNADRAAEPIQQQAVQDAGTTAHVSDLTMPHSQQVFSTSNDPINAATPSSNGCNNTNSNVPSSISAAQPQAAAQQQEAAQKLEAAQPQSSPSPLTEEDLAAVDAALNRMSIYRPNGLHATDMTSAEWCQVSDWVLQVSNCRSACLALSYG